MQRFLEKYGIYVVGFAFILISLWANYTDKFWFNLFPLGVGILFFALVRPKILYYIILFCTPLSLNLEDLDFGFGLAVPTEPLIFGLMIVYFYRSLLDGTIQKKHLFHPVSVLVLLHLSWVFITSFTSEMPLVSFKFFLNRTWFIVCFYFLSLTYLSKPKEALKGLWMYAIPLAGVIIYTIARHSIYGFEEKPAHWVMQPFYKDHTAYGALLAMFFPLVLLFLFKKNLNLLIRGLAIFAFVVFTTGLILSYTRAAWVSILAAFGLLLLIHLRIRFRYVLTLLVMIAGIFVGYQDKIIMELERNKQDSSGDLAEHVQSISNVASDASNLERINRWSCALRMFKERPVFGWGPGTYMFLYAPFQHSSQLTIISTNFGDLGNAHSEYLGPLAEQGLIGALIKFILVLVIIARGMNTIYRLPDGTGKFVAVCCLIGLMTYISHGVLNNFLDTDKASVPFWMMVGILSILDIKSRDGNFELNQTKLT